MNLSISVGIMYVPPYVPCNNERPKYSNVGRRPFFERSDAFDVKACLNIEFSHDRHGKYDVNGGGKSGVPLTCLARREEDKAERRAWAAD